MIMARQIRLWLDHGPSEYPSEATLKLFDKLVHDALRRRPIRKILA